jgi:peptidoglycan/LPS O-acetylase OafA/YrhL
VISTECLNTYSTLFLLEDFLAVDRPCLLQTWYISVEYKLYLTFMGFIYLYGRKPYLTKILLKALILIFYVVGLGISLGLHFKVPLYMSQMQFDEYYVRPWTRAPVFLYGMLLGIIYHEYL